MSEPLVLTERRGAVLEITLNRPPVNAISRGLSQALCAAARELQDDPELRVGLLTAPGERVFCAGWDFTEALQEKPEGGDALGDDILEGHGPGGFGGITRAHWLLKPMIAAINGAAVGGGFEIALACDLIVVADHAWFQLPEMQRGFLPDVGGVQRLPRRLPYNVALDLLLTGRRFEAAEAVRWGLARSSHPAAELLPAARALAEEVADGAPLALQGLKEVLGAIEGLPIEAAMAFASAGRLDLPLYRRMMASEDAREGPRAFLEKRKPAFTGR